MTENLFAETWKKMMDEQSRQFAVAFEETNKLQAQGIERTRTAIDESARVMKSALDAQVRLANEWRDLVVETTRRAGELMTPRA